MIHIVSGQEIPSNTQLGKLEAGSCERGMLDETLTGSERKIRSPDL